MSYLWLKSGGIYSFSFRFLSYWEMNILSIPHILLCVICNHLLKYLIQPIPLLLSRNVKSLSLWWRYSCPCSFLASSLCCVRKCLLRTTQMPQFMRATLLTCHPRGSCKTYNWPMYPVTPVWCVRWQRMCEPACISPQVSYSWAGNWQVQYSNGFFKKHLESDSRASIALIISICQGPFDQS